MTNDKYTSIFRIFAKILSLCAFHEGIQFKYHVIITEIHCVTEMIQLFHYYLKIFQVKERTADPIYDPSTLEEDPQLSGLMSEVNAWKKEHQK